MKVRLTPRLTIRQKESIRRYDEGRLVEYGIDLPGGLLTSARRHVVTAVDETHDPLRLGVRPRGPARAARAPAARCPPRARLRGDDRRGRAAGGAGGRDRLVDDASSRSAARSVVVEAELGGEHLVGVLADPRHARLGALGHLRHLDRVARDRGPARRRRRCAASRRACCGRATCGSAITSAARLLGPATMPAAVSSVARLELRALRRATPRSRDGSPTRGARPSPTRVAKRGSSFHSG